MNIVTYSVGTSRYLYWAKSRHTLPDIPTHSLADMAWPIRVLSANWIKVEDSGERERERSKWAAHSSASG